MHDPWLRRLLSAFTGVLRFAQRENGGIGRVSLNRRELQRIAGGKPPPPATWKRVTKHWGLKPKTAYRVMVMAAQDLGLLAFERPAEKGKHAKVFRVRLP